MLNEKVIKLNVLNQLVDEWYNIKSNYDFSFELEETGQRFYVQIIKDKLVSNCGIYWNLCRYIKDDDYSVHLDGKVSGGRFGHNKYDFEFSWLEETGECGFPLPIETGKKIRPHLKALLKEYKRLNEQR